MGLRPRHYLLLVVILGLAIWNLFRFRSRALRTAPSAPVAEHGPRGTSPLWDYFDQAAALRDAPDAQFSPALQSLTEHLDTANGKPIPPQTSPEELGELNGCRTWLLFYRQAHGGHASKSDWLARSEQHVKSCTADHRDLAG